MRASVKRGGVVRGVVMRGRTRPFHNFLDELNGGFVLSAGTKNGEELQLVTNGVVVDLNSGSGLLL